MFAGEKRVPESMLRSKKKKMKFFGKQRKMNLKEEKEEELYNDIWKSQQNLLEWLPKNKEYQKQLEIWKLSEEKKKLSKKDEEEEMSDEDKEKQIKREIWKRQRELYPDTDKEVVLKHDREMYDMLWNHQKKFLSKEEQEKRIKERELYEKMHRQAIENPSFHIPFSPFSPGCVMPDFTRTGVSYFELSHKRPLTEEEKRRFNPLFRKVVPSLPPLPWDNRQTVPLTPDLAKYFERSNTKTSPCVVITEEEKRKKLAAHGRCFDGSYLTPYCINCDGNSYSGFPLPYPPEFAPIWLAYRRQIRQSHCFDIDDHPGSSFGASVGPLAPSHNFNGKAELLMELADRAILEYKGKECNVFKYNVLKIEKVNHSVTSYYQYWMTVKVSNLTLGSIETFQVHAGQSILNNDDKVIYCCRPKQEDIVGFPSCDACFGLLLPQKFCCKVTKTFKAFSTRGIGQETSKAGSMVAVDSLRFDFKKR